MLSVIQYTLVKWDAQGTGNICLINKSPIYLFGPSYREYTVYIIYVYILRYFELLYNFT